MGKEIDPLPIRFSARFAMQIAILLVLMPILCFDREATGAGTEAAVFRPSVNAPTLEVSFGFRNKHLFRPNINFIAASGAW